MSVLGLPFPSLFQQSSNNHKQPRQSNNGSMAKCSPSASYTSRTFRGASRTKETPEDVNEKSSKEASDDPHAHPIHPSDVNKTSGSALNSSILLVDEPVKKSKVNKKRKGKSSKMRLYNHADQESTADFPCTQSDLLTESPGPNRESAGHNSGDTERSNGPLLQDSNCSHNEVDQISETKSAKKQVKVNYRTEKWKKSLGKSIASGDGCVTSWDSESTQASSQLVDIVGLGRDVEHVRGGPTSCITQQKQIGKENAQLVWQRTGKYTGGIYYSGRQRSLYASGHGLRQRFEDFGINSLEMPRPNGYVNYHRRGRFWYNRADFSRTHIRSKIAHREALEAPRARQLQGSSHGNRRHKILGEIQLHDVIEIQGGEEDKSSSVAEIIKECNSPRGSLQKWIPVSKKDPSVVETDRGTREDGHREIKTAAVCEAPRVTRIDNDMNCLGSGMTVGLDAAYSLQMPSERVLYATGIPVAEYENFLSCASPVIIPSVLNPSISLQDIWGWYERPGNYGLEVKAEEGSRGFEGPENNDIVSFSAHFVPFLSAIQLFGFSGDLEVIFEFFEHEPPQQRKPLCAKVKDLVEAGTSNPEVYGDPSMLHCINLPDLHPASWYSVAWYPIYRIPEGTFHATFLTYHSLGRLAMRPIAEGNALCAVSPVIGMQSYNAQGECWFLPKTPTVSHLDALLERLRALEENAALFAMGHVRKGCSDVWNRHPDYEFFLTRKQ